MIEPVVKFMILKYISSSLPGLRGWCTLRFRVFRGGHPLSLAYAMMNTLMNNVGSALHSELTLS